jgi:hypothetical protein
VAISGDERVKGAGSILRMPETSFNTTQAFNETFAICHVSCKSQHTCQLANIACEKRYLFIAGGKGELRQMAENRTVLFLHFYFLNITKAISLNCF